MVLPVLILLGGLAYRRQRPAGMAVPVLWIGVSYFALLFMAAFGEGAIKFVHIMHVAFAFILLLAVALVESASPARNCHPDGPDRGKCRYLAGAI